jgi:hypothetical protein
MLWKYSSTNTKKFPAAAIGGINYFLKGVFECVNCRFTRVFIAYCRETDLITPFFYEMRIVLFLSLIATESCERFSGFDLMSWPVFLRQSLALEFLGKGQHGGALRHA